MALRSRSITLKNTKNKLQATDFTLAELNLAKDSDSKITAKCYCLDPSCPKTPIPKPQRTDQAFYYYFKSLSDPQTTLDKTT